MSQEKLAAPTNRSLEITDVIPNHTQIIADLQTTVISNPGIPLQAMAWKIRNYYDNWYAAYNGIKTGIHNGTYPGLDIRSHESGISTLYPIAADSIPEYRPPGRPKVEVDVLLAETIRRKLKKAGKPAGLRHVAQEMGIGGETLRRAWQRKS